MSQVTVSSGSRSTSVLNYRGTEPKNWLEGQNITQDTVRVPEAPHVVQGNESQNVQRGS